MRSGVAIVLGLLMASCSSDEGSDDSSHASGGQSSSTGGTNDGTGGATTGTGGAATGTGGTTTGTGGGTGGSQATSGCGMTAESGVLERTIDVAGVQRTFVLSVPEDYDSAQAYPLVFAWHGLGGDGALARLYFGVENASAGAAIFVYPDGLPNEEGQGAWDLTPDGGDVALFDALLASLSAEYCVDAARVFATGHSYGGYMTNRLGCSRADVLRAVAPVAGGPPFGGGNGAACTGGIAALLVHGDNDPTVDFTQGEAARDRYLESNGCAATTQASTPAPCVTYDGCSDGLPVSWCVHQNEHDWPDFAGQAVWGFFAGL